MAEAILFLVVQKIGTYVGGEALKKVVSVFEDRTSLLKELPGSMERIKREFVVMHAFLSTIDTHRSTNKTLMAWSGEVRKIAFDVEDTMDEYVHLIGKQMKYTRSSRVFLFSFSCSHVGNIISRTPEVAGWNGIATRLKKIESDLQHVIQMKERWISMADPSGITQLQVLHLDEFSDNINKEDNLVGIEKYKVLLHKLLAENNKKKSLSIISVWGKGGLGKSSLVKDVYTNAAKTFECHAWISVPRSYDADNLLRCIIKEFYENVKGNPPSDVESMDKRELVETIQRFLRQRQYLVILDDVWDSYAFHDIEKALDNDDGGTVIITTRLKEVASKAHKNCMIQLKVLDDKQAWDLFCKRAFSKDKNYLCPQQLQKLAREIVSRCRGLPLAIVIIAGLLSRIQSVSTWEKIEALLDWELNNNPDPDPVQHALSLSFSYLPRGLKNCFLYCSVFPEGSVIERDKLVRLWIAEGFIEASSGRTREEVGQGYVSDLINRRLLQTIKRRADLHQPKQCLMNNLVREFAVSTSKKERFAVVICDDKTGSRNPRRLSVHKLSGGDDIQQSIHLPQLRTLILFHADQNSSSSSLLSVLLSSKYLTVLDLDGVPVDSIPDEVGDLYNLCYLGLRRTKVKQLPKSINRLNNLQTLDLKFTEINKIPKGFIKLRKLRHLLAVKVNDPSFRSFDAKGGFRTSMEIWKYKDLKTLKLVEATEHLMERLGELAQLVDLGICKVTKSYCAQLSASISKLRSLSFLEISADNQNETLEFKTLERPPQHLHTLDLRGRLEEGVESSLFKAGGSKMRRLILAWSGLTKDPLPSLSTSLPNLSYLCLQSAYHGQLLQFRKEWFPKLKTLVLGDMDKLDEVVIEKGALQSLDYLELFGLITMKRLPQGIEFLGSLKVLWLRELHPKFATGFKKNRDQYKVKHIPKVILISKIGERLVQEPLDT